MKTDFDFIVSCVNKDSISDTAAALSEKGYFVLTETPVTGKGLSDRVQVAEQFHFMPQNQAFKAITDSGILGEVRQVQLSCCHDYHAMSLIRFFLGTGNEHPEISQTVLPDIVMRYKERSGVLKAPITVACNEIVRILKFKEKSAIYDFSDEQYFSDIRSPRIVIRGTTGEIVNQICTYLADGVPQSFEIQRSSYGIGQNLDGMCLCHITGNGQVLYKNPFVGARLSDEEIAIATCLVKMKEYTEGGTPFYSATEALSDFLLCRPSSF